MPTINYERPWLYPKQFQAIFAPKDDGTEHRYGICEASTKSGKTHGCIVWLGEKAMLGKAGQNFWWVAPVYPQAKIAFRRFKRALPRSLYTPNETELTITLANGAVLWFKSGDSPDNLYGEDVYAAVIDEASRVKQDAWIAIRSTLTATKGPIRIIGNVKGKKNWAYKLAVRAKNGAPNMQYMKITAWDAVEAGILDAEEIIDAENTLPLHIFKELYLAEAADDGGNPFGIDAIRACIMVRLSEEEPVCWGWDLAKSYDWTVGVALDKNGKVCRAYRWQMTWEQTIARIMALTGNKPAFVDATGVGDPIVERLRGEYEERPNFEGFKFSEHSRQELMIGLSMAFQMQAIGIPPDKPSFPIVTECEAMTYEYTATGKVRYIVEEGYTDDIVMALALAVRKFTERASGWAGDLEFLRSLSGLDKEGNNSEAAIPERQAS